MLSWLSVWSEVQTCTLAQLMPLPLTVSCFSKIPIGSTFLVPADPGSPGQGPLNGCACVSFRLWKCHTASFINVLQWMSLLLAGFRCCTLIHTCHVKNSVRCLITLCTMSCANDWHVTELSQRSMIKSIVGHAFNDLRYPGKPSVYSLVPWT